jgi:enamine deaminase RidA (YjgF/YER057c/UK114 family)
MSRKLISSGSEYEKIAGYSRAVVDGDDVFVSGTTGFDYATMTISDEVDEQTHQTFRNIRRALDEAGCTLDDAVSVRCYLVNASDAKTVWPIFGEYFAKARPTNTTIICGLVDPRMKIEIEVTARKRR